MDLTVTQIEPGVVEVALQGRMDAAGAAAIDLRFTALAGGNRCMLVDMTAVAFLASLGIRTLLSASRVVLRRGGNFILINPNDEVVKLLDVSGLADAMPILPTREAALAAIG
jgi:anti-anti-sigma factor